MPHPNRKSETAPPPVGPFRRAAIAATVALALAAGFAAPSAAQVAPNANSGAVASGGTGLPLPRFVSLKSDRVNLRSGPGTDYPTGWVFRRAGLPLEVIKEFEGWRQIRDADGVEGWILQSFLSGRRTGLVLPWERKPDAKTAIAPIYESDTTSSTVIANVEAGVIADLHSCDGRWCRVSIGDYRGYIEQNKLWGVYEGETLK